MQRIKADGALSRFRVLDISQVRAGPTCVRQLADFGADVIKIEPPDGVNRPELYVGARDAADMQNLHRNKRSITLDLKAPGARAILHRLVQKADVLVENFRPDVKKRLGLDYESLAAVNPRLVLASISGFGQDGPYVQRPGFDQILQGMCGLMSATGTENGPPLRAGAAVIDVTAGLYAALAVLTALLEREQSGRGQWVDVSLLHAGVALMDFQAARYSADGQLPTRIGNEHPTGVPTNAYRTLDGYLNIAVGGDKQWRRLAEAVGQPSLATDPEYATNADRVRNRGELNRILQEAFATRTTNEWDRVLRDADVAAGPIFGMDQVCADPQAIHSRIFQTVSHPRRGELAIVAQPAKLARTPARIDGPLEDKGNSSQDVLVELGYGHHEIAEFRRLHVI
jgi:crotonobetainyl-CoA:carnitine CoA-transferase CaiB-like acyl-CoA transferase